MANYLIVLMCGLLEETVSNYTCYFDGKRITCIQLGNEQMNKRIAIVFSKAY